MKACTTLLLLLTIPLPPADQPVANYFIYVTTINGLVSPAVLHYEGGQPAALSDGLPPDPAWPLVTLHCSLHLPVFPQLAPSAVKSRLLIVALMSLKVRLTPPPTPTSLPPRSRPTSPARRGWAASRAWWTSKTPRWQPVLGWKCRRW